MPNSVEIYLVGGAVRDQLLKLPTKDKDWVIVGANSEYLIEKGYKQVGNGFPVFLHPINKQEYALARTEKKSGRGYLGFICDFSENVSLEQDLERRDLTINAIAQDKNGRYIDPYHGIQDIENRVLRHVSPAFAEDPLRVLRVARFAARFHHLGFKIADETLALMKLLSTPEELNCLAVERIWLETEKALTEQDPQIYFDVLRQVGALGILFPNINLLYGIPNPIKHHPEIDSFIHTMLVLKQASILSEHNEMDKISIRFAALCHDIGKSITPKDILPHHYGHEKAGVTLVSQLCLQLKIPKSLKKFAEITCEFHGHIHKAFELQPKTILNLFDKIDVWRNPKQLFNLLIVCKADTRGRYTFENAEYPQAGYIDKLYQSALAVDVQSIIDAGFVNQEIKQQLYLRRLHAIKTTKQRLLQPGETP